MNSERTKVLFVCSRNRRRSLTAETIFKDMPEWEVRSAGTEQGARIKVTSGHLGWADVIVVMEKRHKERLRQKHPEALVGKPCVCLFIADDYEFIEFQNLGSTILELCGYLLPDSFQSGECLRTRRQFGTQLLQVLNLLFLECFGNPNFGK